MRTKEECEMEHVKNAIKIPSDAIQRNYERIKEVRATAIYFYWRSGNTSNPGSNLSQAIGLLNVYEAAWKT